MELHPRPGLEHLPRKFWKKVYTLEEKAVVKARKQAISAMRRAESPPYERKQHENIYATAKRLSGSAFSKAGMRAPRCLTQEDKDELMQIYVEMLIKSNFGERHSVDHVFPLRGEKYGVCGLHVKANLVVIPLLENMQKGSRPHPTWMDYSQFDSVKGAAA